MGRGSTAKFAKLSVDLTEVLNLNLVKSNGTNSFRGDVGGVLCVAFVLS
jgi:hypothetical protein